MNHANLNTKMVQRPSKSGVHMSTAPNGLYFVALWDEAGNPNYALATTDMTKACYHADKLRRLVLAVS